MKNIKYIIIFCAISYTFYNCNNAIDIEPKDEIVESNALETVSDIEDATIGVYAALSGANMISWNSRVSDNTRKGVGNRGQGVQIHTWSINSDTGEVLGLWANLYLVINRTNRILAIIDNVPTNNDDDVETIQRLKAELLVIRAMSHFDLARLFSPSYTDESGLSVPYIDYPVILEKPARNTISEVFQSIDVDLSDAKTIFNTVSSNNDNIYITSDVIPALEARIALYKKDFDTAISSATTSIIAFNLNSTTTFSDVWSDDTEEGVIFKLKRSSGDGAVGTIFTDTNGDIFFSPSDELVSLYDDDDVRKDIYFSSDSQEVSKYLGTSANYGLNDIKMFRVAEQYLIRAEAYANNNELENAENDYNELRNNRIDSYSDETFASKSDALEKIALERRRELAFEGHHFFDLKRMNLPIDRWEVDYAPNPTADVLVAGDYRFTLPIPQAEIFANDNMVPNEGYNE